MKRFDEAVIAINLIEEPSRDPKCQFMIGRGYRAGGIRICSTQFMVMGEPLFPIDIEVADIEPIINEMKRLASIDDSLAKQYEFADNDALPPKQATFWSALVSFPTNLASVFRRIANRIDAKNGSELLYRVNLVNDSWTILNLELRLTRSERFFLFVLNGQVYTRASHVEFKSFLARVLAICHR